MKCSSFHKQGITLIFPSTQAGCYVLGTRDELGHIIGFNLTVASYIAADISTVEALVGGKKYKMVNFQLGIEIAATMKCSSYQELGTKLSPRQEFHQTLNQQI